MSYDVTCPWEGWQISQRRGSIFGGELYEIARGREDAMEYAAMLRYFPEETVDQTVLERSKTLAGKDPVVREFTCSRMPDGSWEVCVRLDDARPLSMSYDGTKENEDIRRMGVEIGQALQEWWSVHHKPHGEICPDNIWVTEDGRFLLSNVRSWMSPNGARTAQRDKRFLSPEGEQGRGENQASDVYSLGVVLYWLLNQRRLPLHALLPAPVTPKSEEACTRRRLQGEQLPPPRDGSRELQAAVCRACEANPRKRIRTADALLGALKNIPVEDGEERPENPEKKEEPVRRKQKKPTGEKDRNARGKLLGGLAAALAAVLVGGWFLVHPWAPPTCEEPETCRICGKTRGEALGHQWGRADCGERPLCTVCGAERQEVQEHEWVLGTCEVGAVCLLCFEQQPAPGHSWVEATCLEPKHCADCYLTEGETVDHRWEPATRDHPKRCVDCGQAEGVALMPGVRFASSTCGSYDLLGEDYVGDDGYTLRVGNCVEFAGAPVTVTDSAGANVDMSRFSVEWVGNQVTIRVLEGLEPGVYKIRYGETGIWTWLDYGYSREIYHCQNDLDDGYFLVNQNWKNGSYLTTDGRTLQTSDDWADVTPISIKKLMGGDGRNDYESRIYWYSGEKAERTLLRTYVLGGKYLASDADGAVYLSDTLTEECYWVYQYLLS